MRGLADAERLRRFLRELAAAAETDVAVYLTGGATAVLLGWRDTTIDADILIVPEHDSVYRALPRLKEELRLNVEIASPAHFIPELSGWRERSLLIERIGSVASSSRGGFESSSKPSRPGCTSTPPSIPRRSGNDSKAFWERGPESPP